MGIESDAQKDLKLSDSDADNVLGGKKKSTKHKEQHKAAGHAGPNIHVTFTPTNVTDQMPESDCDPDPSSDAEA